MEFHMIVLFWNENNVYILPEYKSGLYKYSLFRTYILSKAGFLMKLMKNVVTSASSLWTRYLIIRMCVQKFALTWHPLPPVCKRNNLMPLIASLLALN